MHTYEAPYHISRSFVCLSFSEMLSKVWFGTLTFKELMMIKYASSADHVCWYGFAFFFFLEDIVFQARVYASLICGHQIYRHLPSLLFKAEKLVPETLTKR